ncbi:MAG: ABC transporter substrate-binding protein [Spirochaetales bacterium]
MIHRVLVALGLVLVLPVSMAFSEGQQEQSEEVNLEVYYPVAVDAPVSDMLEEWGEEFEEENPGVTVEPVFSGDYSDTFAALQTTIDGGGEPPALSVLLSTDLYDLINGGYIAPVDDFLDEVDNPDEYLDDFLPAYLENSEFDDKIWSIPFQRSAVVLYYNADLFDEHGFDEPQSWEELGEIASELTERDDGEVTRWGIDWPSDWPYWTFQPLPIGAGQNIVGEDSYEVSFDEPEVIDAVQFYRDLAHDYEAMPTGVQASWGNAPTDFASGEVAMTVHSSASLSSIVRDADFEVGVMPIPGREEGTFASVPGGGNFYIMDDVSDAKKRAAMQFIAFLTEPERVAEFSAETGYIPHREAAYDTERFQDYLEEVPQMAEMRDILDYAEAELAVQNLGEVRDIFHDYIQQAYNGDLGPEEAMSRAQEDADEAMEPFIP